MKRSRSLWGLVISVALLAGACASGEVRPPAPQQGAKPGGKLVVGISEPTSVDPSSAADASSALIVRTMCDPLVQFDSLTGEMKPAIAESWQVSDGGRRITVKLRKGVRFHNGRELTSDDVVFSLSRVASEETASPLAPLMQSVVGYEQVHGEEEVDEERLRRSLRGVRVIETYSFEITLEEANADFVNILGHPLASPVGKEEAERDSAAFFKKPVCAGPYMLAEPWQPGQAAIRLTRFPGYRAVNEAYTAAGRGYAEEIEFRVLADKGTELAQFQAGALDVAHLPRSAIPAARQLGDTLVMAPSTALEYIGLPGRVPPFDKPEVRVALSQALDRRAIVSSVFSEAATPAQGFLPPSLGAAHRPSPCGATTPPGADVRAAQAELAKAGINLAQTLLRLYFNDEFAHRQLVQAVAAQWKAALGLETELVPMAWDAYLAKASEGLDGAFRMSVSPPYPGAEGYLGPLFSTATIGRENFAAFRNPDFDRMLDRVARRASEEEDRHKDYQSLEDLTCSQMPVIPVAFEMTSHLVRRQRLASARGSFTEITTGDVALRELFVK